MRDYKRLGWHPIFVKRRSPPDFLVDADDRFTIAYNRVVTVDEKLGNTYRAFIRYVEPTRGRAVRMR